jgi:hypothetical protein
LGQSLLSIFGDYSAEAEASNFSNQNAQGARSQSFLSSELKQLASHKILSQISVIRLKNQ